MKRLLQRGGVIHQVGAAVAEDGPLGGAEAAQPHGN